MIKFNGEKCYIEKKDSALCISNISKVFKEEKNYWDRPYTIYIHGDKVETIYYDSEEKEEWLKDYSIFKDHIKSKVMRNKGDKFDNDEKQKILSIGDPDFYAKFHMGIAKYFDIIKQTNKPEGNSFELINKKSRLDLILTKSNGGDRLRYKLFDRTLKHVIMNHVVADEIDMDEFVLSLRGSIAIYETDLINNIITLSEVSNVIRTLEEYTSTKYDISYDIPCEEEKNIRFILRPCEDTSYHYTIHYNDYDYDGLTLRLINWAEAGCSQKCLYENRGLNIYEGDIINHLPKLYKNINSEDLYKII